MQNCLVQSLLKHTTWKRILYGLLSGIFLQGSLPRETRKLVPNHTSCCVGSQEGTRWGSNDIPAFSESSLTSHVSSQSRCEWEEGKELCINLWKGFSGNSSFVYLHFQKGFTHVLPESWCHLSPFNMSGLQLLYPYVAEMNHYQGRDSATFKQAWKGN